jgi:predicted amidohydrolase YtcJ
MKFLTKSATAAAVILAALGVLGGPGAHAAATLIENVHGYTLAGEQLQRFNALVFDGGKVVRTGEAAALRRAFPTASVIDGHGKTMLPGLIDAHGHVIYLGYEQGRILLTGTSSLKEAQERIRAYARSHPGLAWYRGRGWNQVLWKLGRFPLAAELDAAVSDHPVVLSRIDGHAQWVNTMALRAAGITRATADPVGGRIERDAEGNPSGVLIDKAMDLINRVLPEPNEAERIDALKTALAHMNSVGLTSTADAGVGRGCPEGVDNSIIGDYRKLADRGELTARIYAMICDTGEDFLALAKNDPLIGYGQDYLTVRSVKLFADGALGSRGAALLAPYSDKPDQRGLLFETNAAMEAKIQTALKAGYQVNVHAIGDAANRQVLDGFEVAYKAVGGRELRNRIEHAQIVALSDIPRFRQLDLIASMQQTHATSDMNMAEDRLGAERLKGAYAWHTFLKQGTRIAGGSDFPVESDNPFFGLYSAVTRMDHEGRPAGGWHPEQAMTLIEAFRSFTLDAAYAQHQEKTVGSLEPGKWADFILIDRDLFQIPPADIWKIKVEQTWVGGRRVY